MRIAKGGIVIRSAQLEDAPVLNAWWNDGAVMAHAGFPNGLGEPLEDTLRAIQRNADGLSQRCMIEVDGRPVGELSYGIKPEGVVEPGWKICDPAYQNRGYGTNVILMLLDFLFSNPAINAPCPVRRICWDTMLENARAQHVYEAKIGARKVGLRRDAWRDQLGRLRTSVLYEMTREEYYARHAPPR